MYANSHFGGCFMVLNGIGLTQFAATELSLAEKGIASAKVILTGFVVVFSVLLLLIGVIKLYSFIVGKAQGSGGSKKKKKEQTPPEKKKVTAEISKPAEVKQALPAEEGIPEEDVAVIAAAVATMYGKSGRAKIKSIKKAGGRSAWANAGVLDNTRPF